MTANEIRKKYLEFFAKKGHKIIPSAPLVPENDPTTLFTGSGMQPLIPYLLGEPHPQGKRLANSQKSFRAEDIEEVGDNRHTTFFEMLGNWSLGDYFKKEQLAWFFEFLTEVLNLDPKRLYVTVFSGDKEMKIPKDDESAQIWKELFSKKGIDAKDIELGTEAEGSAKGMQGGRIFYYGVKKNWWSRSGTPDLMPAGEPGGPDSEVFYDFETPHDPKFGKNCHPNCDCGRFLEIGNSVFMEFRKNESKKFDSLSQKNVDFGGGLERLTAATIDDPDVFKIDVFSAPIKIVGEFLKKDYASDPRPFRIIADHMRGAVFMIADGVQPSNKGRGYILRRLIRRAVLEAYQGEANEFDWISKIARAVIDNFSEFYPNLKQNKESIILSLINEAKQFHLTLRKGLREFEKYQSQRRGGDKTISGEEAFILFSTYGFPLELTVEKAKESGLTVDVASFNREFEKHQDLSRQGSAGVFKGGLADHSEIATRYHTATHLMQAALRKVLGEQVFQKGSNITAERTRFDFTHGEKMSEEQKREVERLVNDWIERDLPVKKEIMTPDEARKTGAIGLFGEKYGDQVSIYTVYDPKSGEVVSREFCGGPHVEHTGKIGKFRIKKEEAVAAGIRRIKAVIE